MKEQVKRSIRNEQGGFTLVEVIVIVAVIAIVAGIVVPMIFKQIDEAKITRAEADCKSIASAIHAFRKDLGVWPNLNGTPGSCTAGISLLASNGAEPVGLSAVGYDTSATVSFDDVLKVDDLGCYNPDKYKGPYLPTVNPDPWGNAFVIAANYLDVAGAPVFVLSAGPNGNIDTQATEVTPNGDDIGIQVK